MSIESHEHRIIIDGKVFEVYQVDIKTDTVNVLGGARFAFNCNRFNVGKKIVTIKAISVNGQEEITVSGSIKILKSFITPVGHLKDIFDAE